MSGIQTFVFHGGCQYLKRFVAAKNQRDALAELADYLVIAARETGRHGCPTTVSFQVATSFDPRMQTRQDVAFGRQIVSLFLQPSQDWRKPRFASGGEMPGDEL